MSMTATSAKLMADGDWQAGSLVSIYADGRLRDGHRRDGCAVAARRTTPRAAAAAEA